MIELIKAITGPGDGTFYTFISSTLIAHLAPQLSQMWKSEQHHVAAWAGEEVESE